MKLHRFLQLQVALLTSLCCVGTAFAERDAGWDFGGELIYQGSKDVTFKGGSTANIDDDLGLALTFAYRFNSRLELMFGLDWNNVDYDFSVRSDVQGVGFQGHGTLESWAPRVGINFNLLTGDLTPYVTGGVGWAWIDTNIPDSPPYQSCWWDPWYGYWCGTFQSTRSIDQLTYNFGAGIRWDVSPEITVKLGYEKHWIELDEANSAPGFDQIKLGVSAKY
jgi:opacity protein-like surface antigen